MKPNDTMTEQPRSYRKLWLSLATVMTLSFLVLGYYGTEIYRLAPPVPKRVVTPDGKVLFTGQDIKDGQNVWQSMGGEEVGTIWGHGAYVAPDWTADWLHREATWLLDHWAAALGDKPFAQLPPETQAALKERLKLEIRSNTYHPESGDLVLSPVRAEAFQAVSAHYASLFGDDTALQQLRKAYAIPANTIKTPERQRLMNTFFFWAAWACGTQRPDSQITYTQNWPPETLIGNRPTGSIVVWSVISFVVLLAGIGAMVWYFAAQRHKAGEEAADVPANRPVARAPGHAVHEGDLEVFLGGRGAHRSAGRAGGRGGALRCGGRWLLRHSSRASGCPIRWRARGTRSLASSGLRPRGWRPGCSWPPPYRATNRAGRERASISSSFACSL